MTKLTLYTSFNDLKANRAQINSNQSDLEKESELKAFVSLLISHRSKDRSQNNSSPKQFKNGR
jgi:hypothetical protein